jgi:hypothetical protein
VLEARISEREALGTVLPGYSNDRVLELPGEVLQLYVRSDNQPAGLNP